MPDYTLAVGDHEPYGFSSPGDAEASRHAAAYLAERHGDEWAALPVTLAGPGGMLNRPDEDLRGFCARLHPGPAAVDDVRAGDPVTPDCNGG